ncbi:MFS transporter [Streptomyces sp. MP131-18]|uniref:MFS transporter n=1 Tax=Streptomyces sp. MP131-18 TaxID=1857892 RepID=UPI00097CAB63|nr:MFS transporter [Streptomyces sp. MP131-18]ONK13961.1 putative multidrug-efflux transporter [Streptomyces sp. MP131-18]
MNETDACADAGPGAPPARPPSDAVPSAASAAEVPGGVLGAPYRALTLGCVSTILLIAFEAMAIGTAMPAAAEALDGVSLYAFAFSAFFTTSLLGMVVSGQWCDRAGPTGPVLAGVTAFSAGLLVSGTAQAMWAFVLGRAAQGVGGGLVIVALYVTVRRAYPEHLRPAALAAFSAAWVVPSMVGPVIAGTVTEQFGWRWVFLGITVLVILPVMVMLPQLRKLGERNGERGGEGGGERSAGRFDGRRLRLAGAVSVGAGLLQFGGQELRWLSLVPVALGLALLAPSAVRLLPRGTFRAARGLPSVIALRGLISAAYLSSQSFVPLMLVTQRGLSYTEAGLALAASGGLWACGSYTQSRPWAEPHRFRLVRVGTVLITGGVVLTPLVLIDAVPVWTPALTLALGCFGMGLVTASVGVLVLRLSAPEAAGGNVASLQVCDSLGNVVMLTTVGTLFAALGGDASAAAHDAAAVAGDTAVGPGAFVAVYAVTASAALLGTVVGGRLRTPGV